MDAGTLPGSTTSPAPTAPPPDLRRPAAVIVVVQAVVFLGIAGVAFWQSAQARHLGDTALGRQEFLAGLGAALLTAVGVVAAYGLFRLRRWSRPVAVGLEGLLGLSAITLLADQPWVALVGTAAAVGAIALLARGTSTTRAVPAMASIPTRRAIDVPDDSTRSADNDTTSTRSIGLGVAAASAVTAVVVIAAVLVNSKTLFGLILLAVFFVPVERVFALRPNQKVLRKNWANDVVHFLVNNLITVAMIAAGVVVVYVGLRWMIRPDFQALVASQPWIVQFVEALVLADLAGYAAHRSHHEIGWLWKFHAVHHSIEEMDWLASARLHPVDQALNKIVIVMPLLVFGFSKATVGAFVILFQFQALFIHANVRFRFGPLRWLIGTPEFHHWHHANEPAALNTNFAGQFPWIDKLFGTAHLPKGRMPAAYGCNDPVPDTWLEQMAYPFQKR